MTDIVLARLRRPWGRRGELAIDVHTDWPDERFTAGRTVRIAWDDGRRREATVRSFRALPQGAMLGFEGVDDISAAQALAGGWIVADRSELPPPAEGGPPADEWHHADLVGLTVVTTAGEAVGTVTGIDETAATDLLRIDGPRGEILVPAVAAICRAIDVATGTLTIDPPAGLLDLAQAETADPAGKAAGRNGTPGSRGRGDDGA